jgi:hypothetical protein
MNVTSWVRHQSRGRQGEVGQGEMSHGWGGRGVDDEEWSTVVPSFGG